MCRKRCACWWRCEGGERSEVAQSCPTLQPHGLQPTRHLLPWNLPGNGTGVSCHLLLQGIFPTQGSNPGLPHGRQTLLLSEPPGKPARSLMCFNSRTERSWWDRRNPCRLWSPGSIPIDPPPFESGSPTPEPPSRTGTHAQEPPRHPPPCPARVAQVQFLGSGYPRGEEGLQVLKASTAQPAISRMSLLPSPPCCDAVYPPCLSCLCSPRC